MHIPDPVEIARSRADRMSDLMVDEHTCMSCGESVDYELLCMSPIGDGPMYCAECAGIDE